jgi:hypothetical protein
VSGTAAGPAFVGLAATLALAAGVPEALRSHLPRRQPSRRASRSMMGGDPRMAPDESGAFSAVTLDLGMNLAPRERGWWRGAAPPFDTTWATSCRN